VLLQGEPRDAAVNFNNYRILQRHRAVSLSQHGFLVYISDSDYSTAKVTHSTLIFTALTQNHGTRPTVKVTVVMNRPTWLSYSSNKWYNNCSCLYVPYIGFVLASSMIHYTMPIK